MAVALVALIAPAYATNDISIDFNPESLETNISWDFGTNSNRESCNTKTEARYNYYEDDDTRVSVPLVSFNGTDWEHTQDGHLYMKKAFADSDSEIDCKGSINFSATALFPDHEVVNKHAFSIFMSFAEVLENGDINPLNEAAIMINNMETIDYGACDFDSFDYTTYVVVDIDSADEYVEKQGDAPCVLRHTDLSGETYYAEFLANLP